MSTPYRVPAPPERDEPEAEEPYARLLRRQQKRARIAASLAGSVVAALAVAAIVRPAPARTSARDRATELEARRTHATLAIASARRHASEAQERFAAGVRDAVLSGMVPRDDLGACPFALTAPQGLAAGRGGTPMVVVTRADAEHADVPSQAIAAVLADVARAEAHLAAGRYEEAALYAEALAHPGRLLLDVAVVAETKRPVATSASSFVPGSVEGRAYLYDFAEDRVVCAADVSASSSPSIAFAFATAVDAPASAGRAASLTDAVELDLRVQLERAVASSMRLRASAP